VITIGVPEFEENINFLKDKSLAAQYVRRASMGRLIEFAPEGGRLELLLADRFSSTGDHRTWSFRISRLAQFANGQQITFSDVQTSLRRCQESGKLETALVVKAADGAKRPGAYADGIWFEVVIPEPLVIDSVQRHLSECPILEEASSALFGNLLGEGTNFVSAGEYRLVDFKAGRELTLMRTSLVQGKSKWQAPQSLVFRGFKDADSALTALRVGTIDAFLIPGPAALDRIKSDETLESVACGEQVQIQRKGLALSCPAQFVGSLTQYIG
jgi:ABC-type transport system substrate-binding protein